MTEEDMNARTRRRKKKRTSSVHQLEQANFQPIDGEDIDTIERLENPDQLDPPDTARRTPRLGSFMSINHQLAETGGVQSLTTLHASIRHRVHRSIKDPEGLYRFRKRFVAWGIINVISLGPSPFFRGFSKPLLVRNVGNYFPFIHLGLMLLAFLWMSARRGSWKKPLATFALTMGVDVILPGKRGLQMTGKAGGASYYHYLMLALLILLPLSVGTISFIVLYTNPPVDDIFVDVPQEGRNSTICMLDALMWTSYAGMYTVLLWSGAMLKPSRMCQEIMKTAEARLKWHVDIDDTRFSGKAFLSCLLIGFVFNIPPLAYSFSHPPFYDVSFAVGISNTLCLLVLWLVSLLCLVNALIFMYELFLRYGNCLRICLSLSSPTRPLTNLVTLRNWVELRKYLIEYRLAEQYHMMSWSVALLLLAVFISSLGAVVFLLLGLFAVEDGFRLSLLGTIQLVCVTAIGLLLILHRAASVWTAQYSHRILLQRYALTISLENLELTENQSRTVEMLGLVAESIEDDEAPRVFSLSVKPTLFRIVFGYLASALFTVVVAVFFGG